MSGGYAPCKGGGNAQALHPGWRASFVEKISICIAANFVEGEFEETCQTPFEPLTSQGRVRINRSDPAGAAACPVPGSWQRRRHRIPAPWLGRRVGHRSRKVSCGKRRP